MLFFSFTNMCFHFLLQIKILLAQVGSLKNNNLDEQSLQEVIIEIVTAALRNTNVDFNLGGYPGCPRFTRRPLTPAHHLPLHYDSLVRRNILTTYLHYLFFYAVYLHYGLVDPFLDVSDVYFCENCVNKTELKKKKIIAIYDQRVFIIFLFLELNFLR